MDRMMKTAMVGVLILCAWADWAPAVGPTANSQSVTSAPPVLRRGILLNWSDPDYGSMTWTLVTPPSSGTLEYRTRNFGNNDYTPVPTNTPITDYYWYYSTSQTSTGSDSFTWQVSDGTTTSFIATVTIVFSTNTPVIANDNTNSLVVGSVRGPFSPSYTDPDSYQPVTFQMVTPPGRGLIEYQSGSDYLPVTTDIWVNVSGLLYTSSGSTTGTDTIVWRACDGSSTSAPATITINLTSNTVPLASAQTAGGDIVTNRVRVSLGLSWSDPDYYQRVSCALVRPPAHATLEWSSNGTYIAVTTNTPVDGSLAWYLTPLPGYAGSDNFQWRALDGVATSSTATFSFNLVTNHPPVADNLRGICQPGTNVSLMTRYTDIDQGQVFTCRVARAAAHGSVTVTNLWNGTAFIYTPDNGYTGLDTFTYKVNDGLDDSNEAQVRIQVRALSNRAGNLIVLAVNQLLYPNISNQVERMRADLIEEGYTSKVIPISNTATASNLWATLNAEYANTNQWLTGAILIGNLPKPTANSEYSDLVYWNMIKYDTVTKYITSFDIWVSRIYATDLAYGNEADLIVRALDANHAARRGFSRLPHTAYYYQAWNYYAEQDLYGQRLLETWPSLRTTNEISGDGRATSKKFFPERTDINEAGADALIGGGDLFFESSHGGDWCYMNGVFVKDDLFRLIAQQRVVIADSCSTGPYGGIMNCHLFTRGGGCLLTLGKTVELYMGEYNLANNWPGRAEFRGRLAAGETWGDALLWDYCLSRTAAVWYGDLSLLPKVSPSNTVPLMTPISVSPVTPVAGLPATFSVSVSDADAAQTNGSPLGFRAQMEWFVNNYNLGKGTPTFTNNDNTAGWTNFTYTFPSGGVYTVRAEVMDAWQARSWRELSVTVSNAPVVSNTPPQAQNQFLRVLAGSTNSITLVATDAENAPLTYSIVSAPTNGSLITGPGSSNLVVYVPSPGCTGQDVFRFLAFDGTNYGSTGVVTLVIAPVIALGVSSTNGGAPLAVTFDATGSQGANGTIAGCQWNFGDGATGSGITATHTYNLIGGYTATLIVTDHNGMSSTTTVSITVGYQPNVLTYAEAFESYAAGSTMSGRRGWRVGSAAETSVTNADYRARYAGATYPLNTQRHTKTLVFNGACTNDIVGGTNRVVTVDFMQHVGYCDDLPKVATAGQIGVCFGTNGHAFVLHGQPGAVTSIWSEATGATVASGDWVRVTMRLDYRLIDAVYGARYGRIWINGAPLTAAAGFATNNGTGTPGGPWFPLMNPAKSNMTAMTLSGSGQLDDLLATDIDPDGVTTNGTPVRWMMEHVGISSDYEALDKEDSDGDGSPNWIERIAGTDPLDAAFCFRVIGVTAMAGTNWVTWYGTTNGGVAWPFIMQRLTNLASPPDLVVSNLERSASGTNIWGDGSAPTGVPAFYRPLIPLLPK